MKKIGKIAGLVVDSLPMRHLRNTATLFTLLMLLVSGCILAQQESFTASVSNKNLKVGDRFQLQFTLNTQGGNFTPPDLSNFRILSGPGQSTNMQIINGKMSSSISFNYILMATKEGNFTIDPAAIKTASGVLKSNEINVVVGKGSGNSAQGNSQSEGNNDASIPQGSDKNLFIKVHVSKANPYVGEQVNVTYSLYYREQIIDYQLAKNSSLNGFWSQNIELKQTQRTEVINGERYNVADLKEIIAFPQRSGELLIDPIEMTFVVRQQTQQRQRSIFDQFFGSYRDVKRDIKSNSVKIKVKPLPANQPAGFKGGVGKFSMAVKASKNQVKANESIDLKINITGSGNLKLIETPELILPPDFEVYDPEIDDQIAIKSSGVSGSRTYRYLIIPRHKGNYTIEPLTFSYFDPSAKKYVTLTSDPIDIIVEKGDTESETSVYSNISKEDVKILGNDIKFIKTSSDNLAEKGSRFYGSMLFYLLLIVPPVLFILLIIIRKRYRKLYSDKHWVRSSKATKMARKRLSEAKKHLEAKDKNLFYEEISKALYGYVADKLNMNYSELSKEKIGEQLLEKNTGQESVKGLLALLETCEMARFAPIGSDSSKEIYDKAAEVIKNIENELKG